MQITFNTSEISPKEAASLAALLVTLHGSAVLAALLVTLRGSAVLAALEDVDRPAGAGPTVDTPLEDRLRYWARASAAPKDICQMAENLADAMAANSKSADPDAKAADGYPQPTATAAEAFGAAPAPAGDLDSAGTPWDERIHSGSRGTNKDGTWTRRRNTPDETFDTVMAELKARQPGGSEAANPDPQPNDAFNEPALVPGAATANPDNPPASAAANVQAPPPPPPAAPAVPPAPPASAAPITFPTLMVKITKAQGAGQIDKATVDGFIKELNATSMAQLASQPDKLAELNKLVDTVLGNG